MGVQKAHSGSFASSTSWARRTSRGQPFVERLIRQSQNLDGKERGVRGSGLANGQRGDGNPFGPGAPSISRFLRNGWETTNSMREARPPGRPVPPQLPKNFAVRTNADQSQCLLIWLLVDK